MITEEEYDQLNTQLQELQTQTGEIEAERDSLREELDTLKGTLAEIETELKEAKKLNYTLARKIPAKEDKVDFDKALIGLFGKRGQ